MKSSFNEKKFIRIGSMILIVFFFLPILNLKILGSSIIQLSPFQFSNGDNILFEGHNYGWGLLIIPSIITLITFVPHPKIHKINAITIAFALIIIFGMCETYDFNFFGYFYTCVFIAIGFLEVINILANSNSKV
jgi:hypothetical protein